MTTAATSLSRKFSGRFFNRATRRLSTIRQPLILIADDHEDTRSMLRCFLETNGWRVIEATNGAETVRRFYQYCPDAVLLDVRMPSVDGLEAARRILSGSANARPKPPIILMSACSEPRIRAAAFAAGAVGYLVKPFALIELKSALAAHYKISAAPDRITFGGFL